MKIPSEDPGEFPQPWPKKGDQLVSNQGEWIFNAWIAGRSDLFAHIEGYKRAGDLVWSRIEENPRLAGIDYLVYPMVFLYRHYAELSIKDIIALGSDLTGGRSEFPTHHRLGDLWRAARDLIEKIEHGGYKEDLDAMTALVGQFDKIDRESFAFRYPVTKAWKPSLPGVQNLNLAVFRAGIEKMSAFFEGCRAQFEHYRSNMDTTY